MVRQCRGICNDEEFFSEKRLSWNESSYCTICQMWFRVPTRKPIDFGLGTIQEPNQGEEHYYDITGKRIGVLIIHKIEQLARRDTDGTFLQMIKEFVKGVKCECCGTICRGGPLSKTKYNEAKRKTLITLKDDTPEPETKKVKWIKPSDKQTARRENTIPDSVKTKQIEDTIRRLKVQAEYENDPSLRLDDTKSRNVGKTGSHIRGEIEKTLEDVLRLRNKYVSIEVKQQQQQQDPEIDRYVKGINMSPQIMSYITERLKSTNPELYSKIMSRLGNDLLKEEQK